MASLMRMCGAPLLVVAISFGHTFAQGQDTEATKVLDAKQQILQTLGLEISEDNDGVLLITRVTAEADQRFKAGDRILAANAEVVVDIKAFSNVLASAQEAIDLKVMRSEKTGELKVKLLKPGQAPPVEPTKDLEKMNFAGMTLMSLEMPAVVTKVEPKSAAWDGGVREGDLLLSVDNIEADSFDSLSDAIGASMEDKTRLTIPIEIRRGEQDLKRELQIRTKDQIATAELGLERRRSEREREKMLGQQAANNPNENVGRGDGLLPGNNVVAPGDDINRGNLFLDGQGGVPGPVMAIALLSAIDANSAVASQTPPHESPEGIARLTQGNGGVQLQLAMRGMQWNNVRNAGRAPRPGNAGQKQDEFAELQAAIDQSSENAQRVAGSGAVRWQVGIAYHGDLRLLPRAVAQPYHPPVPPRQPQLPGETPTDPTNDPRILSERTNDDLPPTVSAEQDATGLRVRPGNEIPNVPSTPPVTEPGEGTPNEPSNHEPNKGPYMVVVELQLQANGTAIGFIPNATIQNVLGRGLVLMSNSNLPGVPNLPNVQNLPNSRTSDLIPQPAAPANARGEALVDPNGSAPMGTATAVGVIVVAANADPAVQGAGRGAQ